MFFNSNYFSEIWATTDWSS